MRIYCKLCDKVQTAHVDNCRDAKTNEPFQDIVCAECHLVIASGTDIQDYKRPWVGLTDEEVEGYWDWEDFQCGCGRGALLEMVRNIEAKLKEKNT